MWKLNHQLMYSIKKHSRTALLIAGMACYMSTQAQVPVEAEWAYYKQADQTVKIVATLMVTDEYDPVVGTRVDFYSRMDTASVLLGSAITDPQGVAILEGVPFDRILLDAAHRFYITYAVPDSTSYLSGGEVLSYQDVEMRLSFDLVDSVKQIVVQMVSWDDQGQPVYIEDMDAYLFVPRLFSQLPIGEIYTESEGIGRVRFLTDLPGGPHGELTVYAGILDSDEYGNVEVSATSRWAQPAGEEATDVPRALWSPRPPMWMAVTFVILMLGVWFHYGWIVANMLSIRSQSTEVDRIDYGGGT